MNKKREKKWLERYEIYKNIINDENKHNSKVNEESLSSLIYNGFPQRGFIQNDIDWGIWACNQRMQRKRGLLSQDKIDKLNEIGFQWNIFKRRKITKNIDHNNNDNNKNENKETKEDNKTKKDIKNKEQKLTNISMIPDDVFLQGMLYELRKRFDAIASRIDRRTCIRTFNEIKIDNKDDTNNGIIFSFIEGFMDLLYQTKKEEEYIKNYENEEESESSEH